MVPSDGSAGPTGPSPSALSREAPRVPRVLTGDVSWDGTEPSGRCLSGTRSSAPRRVSQDRRAGGAGAGGGGVAARAPMGTAVPTPAQGRAPNATGQSHQLGHLAEGLIPV